MSSKKSLADMRMEYEQPPFDIEHANNDPFQQFQQWFDEYVLLGKEDANSMTLATATKEGTPSARIVLLKGLQDGKFLFYTNYQSQKGQELDENPKVCINFYWPEHHRQIRVNGFVERVDEKTSTEYFQSRPRGSQIGAWASPQSSPIKNRKILEQRVKELEDRFKGQDTLQKPKQWGGYAVVPYSMEFWQGQPSRLHDRLLYFLDADNHWNIRRLAP